MNDPDQIRQETIARIKAKPEEERTGEERAVLAIDTAIEAAQTTMENAGFKLDHLILVFDCDETPDDNPDAPMVGLVGSPDHPECMLSLLMGGVSTVAEGMGIEVVGAVAEDGGGFQQDGPIHHQ